MGSTIGTALGAPRTTRAPSSTSSPTRVTARRPRAQRVERPRRSRPSISRRRLPIYGQQPGETKGNLLQESEGPAPKKREESAPEIIHYLPRKKPKHGKWKHFFKGMGLMGVWGAGEGSLELMLGYLRRRRPE